MRLIWFKSAAYAALLVAIAHAQISTISNVHFRMNNESNPFDAHDGSIQQFEKDGPYYYHAMGYGTFALFSKYGG